MLQPKNIKTPDTGKFSFVWETTYKELEIIWDFFPNLSTAPDQKRPFQTIRELGEFTPLTTTQCEMITDQLVSSLIHSKT